MAKIRTRLMTADEFFELDVPDGKAALVRGRLIRTTFPNVRHAVISLKIGARLLSFVEAHELGRQGAGEAAVLRRDRRQFDPTEFQTFASMGSQ